MLYSLFWCFILLKSQHELRINDSIYIYIRGLLEKYPTFGREKETGLLGALDT